jgi:hypothetical protein
VAADYPTSIKAFTTKTNGSVIEVDHVNALQLEVTAIETALKNGLQHHLLFTDATYDIGQSGATRPRHLYLSGNVVAGGNVSDVTGTMAAVRAGGLVVTSQAQYDLLYASSASQWARVAGAASGLLVTDGSKAPSISATTPLHTVPAGGGTGVTWLGGLLNFDDTQAANAASAGVQALRTYTLKANSFNADARTVRVRACGTFSADGNTKAAYIYWGGAAGTRCAEAWSNAAGTTKWTIEAYITRIASGSQRINGSYSVNFAPAVPFVTTAAAVVSGDIDIVIGGESAGSTANEVVYEASWIEFLN